MATDYDADETDNSEDNDDHECGDESGQRLVDERKFDWRRSRRRTRR